jgi:hypothetical protein
VLFAETSALGTREPDAEVIVPDIALSISCVDTGRNPAKLTERNVTVTQAAIRLRMRLVAETMWAPLDTGCSPRMAKAQLP